MNNLPETRNSLLIRIRNHSDQNAWSEFESIYRPAIYRLARHQGFQDADALEIVQLVLISISKAIHQFDSERDDAKFRTWLTRIVRNAIVDRFRQANREQTVRGDHSLASQIAPNEEQIDTEFRRAVFRKAADDIRNEFEQSTWQAFWKTAVEGFSCEQVAKQLGKSVGAVYTSRSRVIRRLKERVRDYD